MKKIISRCGMYCDECPAYIAKQTNDDELRIKTAHEWSKLYGSDIVPQYINCTSCQSSSNELIPHCTKCEVRLCGIRHGVETCGHCPEYPCDTYNKFMEQVNDETVRARLEEINKNL